MDRPQTRRILGLFAYAVSALCLVWVFRGINFQAFVHQFQTLQPGYLTIAIAFSSAVYFVNALRWSVLLRPIAKVDYGRTLQSVYIGLFLNEVLPLRPGELVRCYLLSRWSKLPLSNMFAAAAVERVLDGLWLMAGFFLVAFAIKLPRSLLTGALILTGGLVVIAVVWAVHAARSRATQKREPQAGERPKANFLEALASMGDWQVAAKASVVSGVSLACLVLAMWYLMRGARIDLSLAQAAAVLLIIRVGTVIPNTPGNIGSYQFFCVLAMGLFGVAKTSAAAFSLLIYGAFTVPLLMGGAIAVAMSGMKFRTLVDAAHN